MVLGLGTLNVGSLTGRSMEIAEMLKRKRIDICCLQETRWKSNGVCHIYRNTEKENYKLFWNSQKTTKNAVGIFVREPLAEKVLDIKRINSRLISDLNGHVGEKTDGFDNVHDGFDYGERNKDGNRILEFAESHGFCLLNTYFKKRLERLTIYKSGPSATQIDFFAVKQEHRKLFKNVKVIPGESCNGPFMVLGLGTLNVGSLTGRSMEIAEMLKRKRIDICCLQETRWKSNGVCHIYRNTEKENYKLFWNSQKTTKNAVGIFVREPLAEKVLDIKRINSRLISDLNGHVGEKTDGFDNVHDGFDYGERNKDGNRILEFAESHGFCLLNTYFKKRLERLTIYKSGPSATQIDFFAVKQEHRKLFKNVKVIPGESCEYVAGRCRFFNLICSLQKSVAISRFK
ncbi:hypothetical protein HELRODRAFT_160940 [Helobdella robusta]|uniref:Endonuclease/exonuclease/phosphatase domain-containing protein n=1 Tax=Helobdella robusta TaxID=6412 RepID=T1EQV9_HELRO|nr:hypothetical protein HELRODRAFT_160940 [Helobdella robusta]ESO01778.1 hypothetical protein HELRODRAFT_160940 [Helobdella robusta]